MTYEKIVDYVKKALAKKDFSKVADMALQVDVTGEGEGAFYIKVENKAVEVAPYEYYDYTAKLIIPADELIAAVDGKAGKAAFQIDGDVDKIAELLNVITAKKAAAKKTAPAKKAEAPKKAAPAKKAEAPKKAAPAKKAEAPKKAAPAKKAEAPKKAAPAKAEAKKAEAPKKVAPVKAEVKKVEAPKKAAPAKAEVKKTEAPKKAAAKKTTK